jgi:hypothetical protein
MTRSQIIENATAILRAARRYRGCYEWRDETCRHIRIIAPPRSPSRHWHFSYHSDAPDNNGVRQVVFTDMSPDHRAFAKRKACYMIDGIAKAERQS